MQHCRFLFAAAVVLAAFWAASACSTGTRVLAPEGATVIIDGKDVVVRRQGKIRTRPFGWTNSVPYKVIVDGKTVASGSLKTSFRFSSIFWPPLAVFYWPKRFRYSGYDLMADGLNIGKHEVRDYHRRRRRSRRYGYQPGHRPVVRPQSGTGATSGKGTASSSVTGPTFNYNDRLVLKSGRVLSGVSLSIGRRSVIVRYPDGRRETIAKTLVRSVQQGN